MSLPDYIIIALIGVCLILSLRHARRHRCGGDCTACGGACSGACSKGGKK